MSGVRRNTESQTEEVEGGGELTALPAVGKDGTKESALPASAETSSKRRAIISTPPLQIPASVLAWIHKPTNKLWA